MLARGHRGPHPSPCDRPFWGFRGRKEPAPGLARTSSVICPCPLGCAREPPGAQPPTLFYRDMVESFTAWWELSLFPVAVMKYSKVLETAGPAITVRRAATQLPFFIVHSRASPQRMVQPVSCREVKCLGQAHNLLTTSSLLQKSTALCHRSKLLTVRPMMSPLATTWWTSVCHPPPMDRNPISYSAARTCDHPAPPPSVRARPWSSASPSVSSRPPPLSL